MNIQFSLNGQKFSDEFITHDHSNNEARIEFTLNKKRKEPIYEVFEDGTKIQIGGGRIPRKEKKRLNKNK